MAQFIGIIHREGTTFGVCFPDFPGCVTSGKSMQEVHNLASQALQAHIDVSVEYGDAMPQTTTTLDEAAAHPLAKGAVAYINVQARLPGRSKRINVTLDEDLIHSIDSVANNRSAFLAQAAMEKLAHINPKIT